MLPNACVATIVIALVYPVVHVQMGRARTRDRRAGIRRDDPIGRTRAEVERQQEHEEEREEQRKCWRNRQRELRRRRTEAARRAMHFDVDDRSMSDADMSTKESVNQRLVRRDVAAILACMEKTLRRRRQLLRHK